MRFKREIQEALQNIRQIPTFPNIPISHYRAVSAEISCLCHMSILCGTHSIFLSGLSHEGWTRDDTRGAIIWGYRDVRLYEYNQSQLLPTGSYPFS